jgi:hypothetical protein
MHSSYFACQNWYGQDTHAQCKRHGFLWLWLNFYGSIKLTYAGALPLLCPLSNLLGTLHSMSLFQLIWLLLLKFTWYATFIVFIAAHLAAVVQVYLIRYI